MRSAPFKPAQRRAVNQHDQRFYMLCARILAQRESMIQLIREHRLDDPEFAARLQSLLLYAEGRRMHEIMEITGLTTSTLQRVRRRFENWGLGCVKDPARLPPFSYLHSPHGEATVSPATQEESKAQPETGSSEKSGPATDNQAPHLAVVSCADTSPHAPAVSLISTRKFTVCGIA